MRRPRSTGLPLVNLRGHGRMEVRRLRDVDGPAASARAALFSAKPPRWRQRSEKQSRGRGAPQLQALTLEVRFGVLGRQHTPPACQNLRVA